MPEKKNVANIFIEGYYKKVVYIILFFQKKEGGS
jgi:hypothetical protein